MSQEQRSPKWEKFRRYKEKMRQVVVPAFAHIDRNYAEKLAVCGEQVNVAECVSCHARHFVGFMRCKSRWCINCNYLRSLLWMAKLMPVFKEWLEMGYYICMLNFTITDMPDLSDAIGVLEDSFRFVYNSSRRKRERWKARFPGGIRSLEVKLGVNSGLWHPHLHCLVMQDTWERDFEWLKTEWKDAVERYHPNGSGSVWFKQVKGDDLLNAVCETLKYILKPDDSLYRNLDDLYEAYIALKGKRQVNTWGLLRGITVKDDDVEEAQEDNLAQLICQVCGGSEFDLRCLLYDTILNDDMFDIN